ncbi:DNA cytosine methyltransferase [uncultured Umboniibacter sp.]|uniref:DNA cytosine methyltransferase n=1 Tax=uncultured Umboniibacter sp. TaxID=1798917 RepID=UPI002636796A|nr:DNA cytosine methyltransferase [uncultured Umboniibacter sp.]
MLTVLTKVGKNREKPRIFIEGKRLLAAGLAYEQRFDVTITASEIRLQRNDETGELGISKRSRRNIPYPILDINRAGLSQFNAGVGAPIEVVISGNRIIIRTLTSQLGYVKSAKRVQSGRVLRVASLYHGLGVLDAAVRQGMAKEGLRSELVLANEYCSKTVDVAMKKEPGAHWINGSIAEVSLQRLPDVDVAIMGPPCTAASPQGISSKGLKKPEDDPLAGQQVVYYLSSILAMTPAIVVIENTENYRNTASASIVRSVLADQGFVIDEAVLDGNDFGALEARKRWVLVARHQALSPYELEITESQGCMNTLTSSPP